MPDHNYFANLIWQIADLLRGPYRPPQYERVMLPMATLTAVVQSELDRVSQTLTGRIRQLAERYATPLPQLVDEVAALAARVDGHLKKMGAEL